MFSALLKQCGYRNYIPIMVHNRPYQFNTKQEDFKKLPVIDIEKFIEDSKKKEKNFNDIFKSLDIPDNTFIH
tara:strand:+ start:460 stop:675 length:216 start_codon:yes stop_codon:yes gene_type:complete